MPQGAYVKYMSSLRPSLAALATLAVETGSSVAAPTGSLCLKAAANNLLWYLVYEMCQTTSEIAAMPTSKQHLSSIQCHSLKIASSAELGYPVRQDADKETFSSNQNDMILYGNAVSRGRMAYLERTCTYSPIWFVMVAHPASTQDTSREIYRISLNQLSTREQHVDITSTATPERYRLVNCAEVVSSHTLSICEYSVFPCVIYSAISYVWRGNALHSGVNTRQEFSIRGAEDADPIGVDVLFDACAASLACGASHLWLDRLCIMQTSKQDKRWQIREMYRMYLFSTLSIVVPGGLRRLVPLVEDTQWIHRGWTLQEVLAPPSVAVLFAWTHGPGEVLIEFGGENWSRPIELVTPSRSAMLELHAVLTACTSGYLWFTPSKSMQGRTHTSGRIPIEAALFGQQPFDPAALHHGDTTRTRLPHVTALGFAMSRDLDTDEMRDFCIWQCALARTSSRPVDMVFSVMGIFGVSLDPAAFATDDRIGATIALARAILAQGRSASWLGISVFIPPCPYLSTFPTFPKTSVAGKALIDLHGEEKEVAQFVESHYPNEAALCALPKGSMDTEGYHTFEATAIPVSRSQREVLFAMESPYDDAAHPRIMQAMDGTIWELDAPDETHSGADEGALILPPICSRGFAVMLGFYNGVPAVTDGNTIRAMLLIEHAPGKFHVQSYFLLNAQALVWARSWKKQQFCVGGPKRYAPIYASMG
ncbi:hypothetical protein CERSUDRAFT_69838 [Gelatoporia subvermispora B]|uniref:Heterokaryon incompatibility domain-containing protein n=1 Tax=Ceriporiopsis subvermispora (strain B) TaxID=914234 RepID=M2R9Y7_CERS8|nr:hypothetical protein CERSUDRAFT_69838 [Gelatoporia subvermispora B]